jgi:hypothetical protein
MKTSFGNPLCLFQDRNGCELLYSWLINAQKLNKYFSLNRDFKICRLVAISNVLAIQAKSEAMSRVRRNALLLTAACVWLFNGMSERPDDGIAWRRLMDAVLPVTYIETHEMLAYGKDSPDNDNPETGYIAGTPYYPHGIIFLHEIYFGGGTNIAPRLKLDGPFLPRFAVEQLFGETEESMNKRYLRMA